MSPLNWKGRPYRPVGSTGFIKVYKPDVNELMKPLSMKRGLGSAILTGNAVNPQNEPALTPSSTPGATPTLTPTLTETMTPTPSVTETLTPTPSVTETLTPTVTPSITASLTPTLTETMTPTPSVTETLTPTPSMTQTATVTPSVTPTLTPTASLTPTISVTPTLTSSPIPQDCLWNTTDEFWSGNTNQWQQCQDVPPSPSVTPTQTITPSITPTLTLTPTLTITPSLTASPTLTPSPTLTQTPSSTPPPFSPSGLTNLDFWYMSNSGFTPSSWTNYGTLGGALTQADSAKQPQTSNTTLGSFSGTGINFNSNDQMGQSFSRTYSAFTQFIVVKKVGSDYFGTAPAFRLNSTGIYTSFDVQRTTGVAPFSIGQIQGGGRIYDMTANNPDNLLLSMSGLSASANTYRNEVLLTSQIGTYTVTAPTNVQIGGVLGGNAFTIFEIICYNRQLTTTEYNNVMSYLKTKYQFSTW